MVSFTHQIAPILFIFSVIHPFSVHSAETQINLSNDIDNEKLSVSCQSSRQVEINNTLNPGVNFTWAGYNDPSFHWYCLLTSIPKDLTGVFMIFDGDKDSTRCGKECMWSVRHDGIYLYINGGYTFQFRWPGKKGF